MGAAAFPRAAACSRLRTVYIASHCTCFTARSLYVLYSSLFHVLPVTAHCRSGTGVGGPPARGPGGASGRQPASAARGSRVQPATPLHGGTCLELGSAFQSSQTQQKSSTPGVRAGVCVSLRLLLCEVAKTPLEHGATRCMCRFPLVQSPAPASPCYHPRATGLIALSGRCHSLTVG